MTIETTAGPITIEGVRGWPQPDCSDDPCDADANLDGWLPWAVILHGPDSYTGLYSCDRGHTWTSGFDNVAHRDDPDLRALKISPYRTVPSDAYLREHDISRPIRIELIDWSPVFRRRRAGPTGS